MGLTSQHTVCFILLLLDTLRWEGKKETLAALLWPKFTLYVVLKAERGDVSCHTIFYQIIWSAFKAIQIKATLGKVVFAWDGNNRKCPFEAVTLKTTS